MGIPTLFNRMGVGNAKVDPHDLLCFTATTNNSAVKLTKSGTPTAVSLEYSNDKKKWKEYTIDEIIPLNEGQKVYFRGDNDHFSSSYSNYYNFKLSGNIAADGNVMSLLDKNCALKQFNSDCIFFALFKDCTSLTDMPKLPATTLTTDCYDWMFNGCTSLTGTTDLIAEDVSKNAYTGMFRECTALKDMPKICATTVGVAGMQNMFKGCSALTGVQQLKPSSLSNKCYAGMFNGCTALTTAPILSALTLAEQCYDGMFNGCSALKDAPELPASLLSNKCYTNMFFNCTALTGAPILSATTLADHCYNSMFNGCTALKDAPELPATTLENYCYNGMFKNCFSLTGVHELPATSLKTYSYNEMFSGCNNLSNINVALTGWDSNTNNWVYNVAASGVFYAPKALSTEYGTNRIPTNWTRIEKDNLPLYLEAPANEDAYLELDCVGPIQGNDVGFEEQGEGWDEPQEPIYHPAETHWDEELQEEVVDVEEWYEELEPIHHDGETHWVSVYEPIPPYDFEYSTDLITWQSAEFVAPMFDVSTGYGDFGYYVFNAPANGRVYIRGNNTGFYTDENTHANFVTTTLNIKLGGNIMSLLDKTIQQTAAPDNCFNGLFAGLGVADAEKMQLPATTLGASCYSTMFKDCYALSAAPAVLPAQTLSGACYHKMFNNCYNLVKAPAIRATTLAPFCYQSMFEGCTALSTLPSMGSLTYYPNYSCSQMFQNCTSLSSANNLIMNQVTEFDNYACAYMFDGCTSLIHPINTMGKDRNTIVGNGAAMYMYKDCTSLDVTENFMIYGMLPAGELSGTSSYEGMFMGCTSLTRMPYLPATTVPGYAYAWMFEGCSSLNDIYYGMDVTTFEDNMSCARMFKDCTSLTYGQTIDATTLGYKTYNSMFNGCSSLKQITVKFTDWNEAEQSTNNWLSGVALTGTFYCPSNLDTTTRDASHVPDGWTVAAS